ncbi:choice-of-anchor D domain-containing protein [Olleya aquimaris]|uniref:Putative secreted protein (Por secretion system target) n=1 Tax=Olleya aquimaris TaxID=639310 RepID=A0A327R933_9FLAO|nr:choice-of-anchor D domain-containing protein [Olleya aquimaris]RAJ12124.1 putative secreted protein (Por secretion system target) [Olleya aquimaris]
MKHIKLLLIVFITTIGLSYGQGSETFNNSNATGTYGDNSFVGDNGVTWTYIASRNESTYGINGNGLMLRRASDNSRVTSSSVTGGIGNFTCSLRKAFTGAGNRQVELFVNGVSQGTSIAWDNTNVQTFTVNGINITGNVTIEIRNITERQVIVDDISWTAGSTATLTYYNLQFPVSGTIQLAENYDVYAQAFEGGVTPGAGPGTGIESWIGYSTTDATTTADFNNASWTWVTAPYFGEGSGANANNDEYRLDLGAQIPATGTYYYVSRFRYQGGPFTYGGISGAGAGNAWDGSVFNSGVLTINAHILDFVNLQSPATGSITTGGNFEAYAQVYEPGVTDTPASQGANIEAWIGYSTTDATSTADFTTTSWTWVPANYNPSCGSNCGTPENNDEYFVEFASGLTAGTYYYASRFRIDNDVFYYGGYDSGGGDGFWDGTNDISGVLTITDPPVADVVITEIMYNSPTPGTDYEWIEICNLNSTAEDVSNYIIDVNGSTEFTFPPSTVIPANSCVTVLLGLGTSSPECPFTPDYGSPSGTNNLPNSSATISLIEPIALNDADSVFYDSGDGADGNGSTLHVVDATSDNSNTLTNWQEVLTGGSPGSNSLVSPCTVPELQLVDDSNTDQNCGYTINFGSQATGFTTNITFDIDNDGTLNLDISSLVLSGANSGEFSIVSPAAPFTVTPGNTQTVTLQFAPTTIGTKNATLTINNNDADEGACTVLLEGIGTTPEQEINIEGDVGAFPDIANGDTTPSSLDNTLFAAQNIGNSQAKSFRIQNVGTADLNVSGITIGGTNPGDFTLSVNPSPATITPMQNPPAIFEITFSPLASGTRTAIISVASNDADENPYTFMVQGDGLCNAGSISILPTSGPDNTIVTVTGTNLTTATATVSGIPATVNNVSATTMEVTIPTGATSGNIEVTDDLGCPASAPFTVIRNSGSCGNPSGLMMTEVYDENTGSRGYIELYNATGATIDLTDYRIDRYGDLTTTISSHSYNFPATGIGSSIADGEVLVGMVNSGGTGIEDFAFGGSTSGFNADDRLELVQISTSTVIDDFHDETVGGTGFVYRRNTNVSDPNPNFDSTEWTTATQGDISDLGNYTILTNAPTITSQPVSVTGCNIVSFSVSASPGNGGTLTYQWLYNDGVTDGWSNVTSGTFSPGAASGETTDTLTISGFDTSNYQFYCQVIEDGLCITASNAVRGTISTTTWDGVSWSNGLPTVSTQAIISANYDTNTAGQPSFTACSLVINPSFNLTIAENTYVEVYYNVINNGRIFIQDKGSFVQVDNAATYDDSGSSFFTTNNTAQVTKTTGIINNWYEYTYWSSPVSNETVEDALFTSNPDRRFVFNAANFEDSTYETNNDNTATPYLAGDILDDIDDNADDWSYASGLMIPGVGYAATLSTTSFSIGGGSGNNFGHIFEGTLNNGLINVPVFRNDASNASSPVPDNNWNFIGNPYPSAIDVDLFFTENVWTSTNTTATLDGTIYLWSQNTAPSATTNGNEGLNFSDDYAIINGAGEIAGGDGITPNRYIPSGQGFFVKFVDTDLRASSTGTVVFNNDMRVRDNNTQFFRNSNNTTIEKLRLNLTSDTGLFSQTLVAYSDQATHGYDGGYFDAAKTSTLNAPVKFGSSINSNSNIFAIQGRDLNLLDTNEVVPLAFSTSVNNPTIYNISIESVQGDFLTNNTVYLKDNLLSTIHDLSSSDYSFTSEVGEFNYRFEVVFNNSSLGTNDYVLYKNNLSIIELENNEVLFTTGSDLTIKSVQIFDALGRLLYNLKGYNSSETYNLSNLSQAAYVAKVELSNGQVISKKAIKK